MYRKVVKIAMESSYTPHSDYTLGWYICYNLWTSIDLLFLTKVHTLFRSPQSTPPILPSPQGPRRTRHHTTKKFEAPPAWGSSSGFTCLWWSWVLRITSQVPPRISLSEYAADVFLMIRLGCFFGRKITRDKMPFPWPCIEDTCQWHSSSPPISTLIT